MASVDGASESQTAVTVVPATSTGAETDHQEGTTTTEATNPLVQKISTVEQLDELLGDTTKVFLIEFFAEWCGPCKLMALKLEQWASQYDVTIVKIDIDELEDVAIEYNVGGIPSFTFIKDRTILEQVEGSTEDKIIAALEQHCKTHAQPPVSEKRSRKSKSKDKHKSPAQNVPNVTADEAEKVPNTVTEESETAER